MLDPLPDDEPELDELAPELEPEPPPLLLPPEELPLPELPDALPSVSGPPFEDPMPDPPAPVPSPGVPGLFAHPISVDAPSHASAVHRAFAIAPTLQSFAAVQRMAMWMLTLALGLSRMHWRVRIVLFRIELEIAVHTRRLPLSRPVTHVTWGSDAT